MELDGKIVLRESNSEGFQGGSTYRENPLVCWTLVSTKMGLNHLFKF